MISKPQALQGEINFESNKYRNTIEVRQIANDLRLAIGSEKFSDLMRVNPFKSTLSLTLDWISIFISIAITYKLSIWLTPLSLVVIGSRQRALSNLVHDASHYNLFASKTLNDFISNFLGAYPMLDCTEKYRTSHLQHHLYLGSLDLDPDSKTHLRYGFNDQSPPRNSYWRVMKGLIFNLTSWRDSIWGSFFTFPLSTQAKMMATNLLSLTVVAYLCGTEFSIYLVAFWILARFTSYHVIRVFAEFMDHAGLSNETIVNFTRNLPHKGLLPWLFHPHQDTYHLIHHLFPKIPHYNLHQADTALKKSSLYVSAHHCDAYFVGTHTAVSCLSGNCLKTGTQM